jgi:hypothetical protein
VILIPGPAGSTVIIIGGAVRFTQLPVGICAQAPDAAESKHTAIATRFK